MVTMERYFHSLDNIFYLTDFFGRTFRNGSPQLVQVFWQHSYIETVWSFHLLQARLLCATLLELPISIFDLCNWPFLLGFSLAPSTSVFFLRAQTIQFTLYFGDLMIFITWGLSIVVVLRKARRNGLFSLLETKSAIGKPSISWHSNHVRFHTSSPIDYVCKAHFYLGFELIMILHQLIDIVPDCTWVVGKLFGYFRFGRTGGIEFFQLVTLVYTAMQLWGDHQSHYYSFQH